MTKEELTVELAAVEQAIKDAFFRADAEVLAVRATELGRQIQEMS